jgi:HK97 family phage portal protein
MTEIFLPNGMTAQEFRKTTQPPQGKGKITGLSPWKEHAINGLGVKGSATKKGSWRDYYDMYRQHSIVRSAIEKIAKTATNVGYDFVPRDSRTKIKTRELNVLKAFFSQQTDFVYELRRIYKDLLICGDAYLYVVPDRRRRPVRLKRLHPKTVHIKMSRTGKIEAYYQKDPDNILDEAIEFQPHEILHFRIDDPDNDIYGLSPLESLKWAVSADLYAQRYNAAFFQNSGVTGTIIGVRNANPDEVQRNRAWLEQNYTGPENAHKPIVIEGESITIDKAVATHTEMGFLAGRTFIITEILAVLDVPPAKVGIMETANRSNSKEQDKTFRTESVSPLQYIVESVINEQFVKPILGVENTIFVHSEGDTRDAIEQMDYYTKGEAWGVFNVNEIRAKLGMAPVEGGDINAVMSPTGFIPLDRFAVYFEPLQLPEGAIGTPDDPIEGEPVPKPTPTARANPAISRESAKNISPLLAAQAALTKLMQPKINDRDLRQTYSYLIDAEPLDDTRITNARDAIAKACTTNDTILKMGYIERAQDAIGYFIAPTGENGYVEPAKHIAKQRARQEAALDEEVDEEYDG